MIKEIKMYTLLCDVCGKDVNNDTDYAAWTDTQPSYDLAKAKGWHLGDDGKHYCDNCHSFDENDNLVVKETENAGK